MIERGQPGDLRRYKFYIKSLCQRFPLDALRGVGRHDRKQDAASLDGERAHQLFRGADAVPERYRIDFWILRDGKRSRIAALAQIVAGGDRPIEGFVVPAKSGQFTAYEPMRALPEFLTAIVTERRRIVHHGLRRLGLFRHEILVHIDDEHLRCRRHFFQQRDFEIDVLPIGKAHEVVPGADAGKPAPG
jgi:hypothetical protein